MSSLKCPLCKQAVSSVQFKHLKKDVEKLFQKKYSQKLDDIKEKQRQLDEREKSLKKEIEDKIKSKYNTQMKSELQKLKSGWTKLQKEKDKIAEQKRKLREQVTRGVEKKTLKYRDQLLRSQRRESGYLQKIEGLKRQLDKATTDELGGISEEKLHEMLITHFGKHGDEIEKIEKRRGGADFIQHVMYRNRECGKILYENKNTVNWDKNWIKKIKQDMIVSNTQYGIIVSNVFPRNVKYLTNVNGITVAHASVVLYVSNLIRDSLVDLEKQSLSEVEKETKMSELYQYITGDEFPVAVRAIFDAIKNLDDIRQAEQKTHANVWTKEENETRNINLNMSKIVSKFKLIVEKEPIYVVAEKKKKKQLS